jgi:hypothetical protein
VAPAVVLTVESSAARPAAGMKAQATLKATAQLNPAGEGGAKRRPNFARRKGYQKYHSAHGRQARSLFDAAAMRP